MKFLNKKEQVLDTLLTPHGEKLLADGLLKPEYYAFFDDNILYEKQWDFGIGEGQNNIEPRIQEKTPQLETQVVFSDRNKYRAKVLPSRTLDVKPRDGDTGPELESTLPPTSAEPIEQTVENIDSLSNQYALIERRNYGPHYALGTTEKFTSNAPAWSVSLLRGEISKHADHEISTTAPILDIPQLDMTLTYSIDVIADADFISDTQLAVTFPNGEILDIQPEIALAQIEELNVEFTKDNFEIEVFEVTTELVNAGDSLRLSNPQTVEVLKPLKFIRKPSLVQNDILLDEDEISSTLPTPTPNNVEYYFDIRVDEQIDERLICSSIEDSRSKGKYIDIDFECKDTTNIALVDIYGTAASSKPCPDLDDPCEDKPGTVY